MVGEQRVTTSLEDIHDRLNDRKRLMGQQLVEMGDLTAAYEGTVTVPLPELDKNERVAVANLIAQGLDQMAMRIANNMPDVVYPPLTPGQDLAEKRARVTRQATIGWWDQSSMDLKLARRARWLIGYATAPATVRPDTVTGAPCWVLRSPLCTFPAIGDDPDEMVPTDTIFTFKRSLAWLQKTYPGQMGRLSKGPDVTPDTMFELMEFVDADELVLGVIGRPRDSYDTKGTYGTAALVEVERLANRAGCPLATVPGRLSLSRRQGAYQGMIGLYQAQAKLMALEVIAVTRDVFPNTWAVSRAGEMAQIVTVADGRRGIVGEVRGAEIQIPRAQPGYMTAQTIDRLERYERMTGGIPAEMQGESQTNVSTGRRGDQLLSAVVDFPVAEAQRIFERAMEYENKMAVAVAKGWFGNEQRSFYVGRGKGAKGRVDYVPNRDFVSDANIVAFAHAGSDANALVVGLGQRLGVGTLSKHTARALDPLVDDPMAEEEWITTEALESALLAGLTQQVSSGALSAVDVARIKKALVTDEMSLEDAVLRVHSDKQTEQATSGPPGTPEGPVPPGAPAAQPGLAPGAPPGAGASIAPTPNEQGLSQLLGALKGGSPNQAMVR